jgi:hypothetical protein
MGLCQSNTSKNNSQPNLTNHAEDKRYFVVEKSRSYGAGGFEELMDGFKNNKRNSGLALWQT